MPIHKTKIYHLQKPDNNVLPFLVSSPHSGQFYPQNLLELTRLPLDELRKSEDSFVHELFHHVSNYGGSLLNAELSRIFCDLNRWAWELDPKMFKEQLPPWCDTESARVKNGIGTVHKISNSGKVIFKYYLSFTHIEKLIQNYWFSYHQQIKNFIHNFKNRFNGGIILDVHSMPSPRIQTPAFADIILGDNFSKSCCPLLINQTARYFQSKGLAVKKNIPYAGGYITSHYGNPLKNIHVLQIEINKKLYLNEECFQLNENFFRIQKIMTEFLIMITSQWKEFLKI